MNYTEEQKLFIEHKIFLFDYFLLILYFSTYLCKNEKNMKSSKITFIYKANIVHKNQYDYSLVDYINDKTKIIIICKKHGHFIKSPRAHLQGEKCFDCYKDIKKEKQLNYVIKLIKKFNEIYNNKYDYSKINYKGVKYKIKILCPYHGIFEQFISSHKRGDGCLNCKIPSKDELIEKLKVVHGIKYDYSLLEYKGCNDKIKIICKEHGIFNQTFGNHLRGQNCPQCYRKSRRNTNEIIIKRFRCVNGNTYDYSLVEYVNYKTKIEIICPTHGIFKKTPQAHLKGHGCFKCYIDNRPKYIKRNNIESLIIDNEQIIKKLNNIHENKYNYPNFKYNGITENIVIECKKHGKFIKQFKSHHNGSGCRLCKIENMSLEESIVKDRFIKIHGNTYDYSEINYKSMHIKVKIKCHEHGEFKQLPHNHIKGSGCPQCAKIKRITPLKIILEKFVIIHNNEYNYSEIGTYYNGKSKINIKCKKHGFFRQEVNLHLSGGGCPTCSMSNGEKMIKMCLLKKECIFEIQKKFHDCVNPISLRKLPFDFYLPEKNILIEFDGEQHYKMKTFGCTIDEKNNKNFKRTQENDKIKNNYAIKNKINLLRISYLELNNIENILNKYIK